MINGDWLSALWKRRCHYAMVDLSAQCRPDRTRAREVSKLWRVNPTSKRRVARGITLGHHFPLTRDELDGLE